MSDEKSSETDWARIGWLSVGAIIAFFVALKGQPLIDGNDNAVSIMATAFSILAGFLIAIMTIVATPASFEGRSWRYYFYRKEEIGNRLSRHRILFLCYLTIIGLIFVAELLSSACPGVAKFVQHAFLFLGTLAFIMSLRLPFALMKIQMDHHDEIIKHHKKKAGITD